MKKRIPVKLLTVFICCNILIMPFFSVVFADGTYINLDSSSCILIYSSGNTNLYFSVSNEVRMTIIHDNSTARPYAVSLNPFNYKSSNNDPSCNSGYEYSASYYTYNGVRYYIQSTLNNGSLSVVNPENLIPVNYDSLGQQQAILYTYGDLAVDPEEPSNIGLLNASYYTRISGSGDKSTFNEDVITWDMIDSNGNFLQDYNVEIQAVPGHFEADSKVSLLQETFNNWVSNSDLAVQVYKGSTVPNERSFFWGDIANRFESIKTWNGRFWSLFAKDDYWYQYGWIYQIRLLDEDFEPLTEWQDLYTATAYKPSATNTIENSDDLTPELVNTIEDINDGNNITINWYINNYEINVQPEEQTSKPWWSYILDAILDLISSITGLAGDILAFLGHLIDDILGLFKFDSFSLPDFENEKQNIINNTGMVGETINFTSQLEETIRSAEYVEPKLYYPGFVLMDVQLIPEININLNDYIQSEEIQQIRNTAYLVTDGMIYFSLVLLIKNKVMGVLKK